MEVHQLTSIEVDKQLIHILAMQKFVDAMYFPPTQQIILTKHVVSSNMAIGLETPSTLKKLIKVQSLILQT